MTTEIPNQAPVAALWTTKDLAKFLGCSERQIPRLREEGLPAVRVGALVRFIPSRVMAWLDSRDDRARQLTDIAKRHGITRAAVSKRCVELTELLDLKPSRAMRSLTARKRYRAARIHSTRSHELT